MEERNEDALSEAQRYLSDLVAFEGTQFTAPESVAATGAEEPAVGDLEAFRRQICDCTRCRLGATRQQFVFGSGDPAAGIMFIGEAPGCRGRPRGAAFCGESWSTADQDHRGHGPIPRRGLYLQHTQVPPAR